MSFECEKCANFGKEICRYCTASTDNPIPTMYKLNTITEIKDSGERTQFFDTNGNPIGQRDMHTGKGRMDLLPWAAIIEVAKHCEQGALKYGERNCEKGIPIHSLIDSGIRHLAKYMMGMKDEPHLRAAAWNILFAIYMEIEHPEMQDIPSRLVGASDINVGSKMEV